MKAIPTELAGVFILEPAVFSDERGWFFEAWNRETLSATLGQPMEFVQDNQSRSLRGVLRGLHYQLVRPQGKLVRVLSGAVFDVAVDIRRSSPAFGRWVGVELSEADRRQLWIPPGFAHGFLTLSDHADVFYKVTDFYSPDHDRGIRWNDPTVGIDWPTGGLTPLVSSKDSDAPSLLEAEVYE